MPDKENRLNGLIRVNQELNGLIRVNQGIKQVNFNKTELYIKQGYRNR